MPRRAPPVGAVEGGRDDGVAAGLQAPRAGELHGGAGLEREGRDRVILDPVVPAAERLAAGEQPCRQVGDRGEAEHPQGEVDEVDAEIHDAAAARERRIVEPRLVGPVGVVEDEIDRVDAPQLARLHQLADAAHAVREAIREIDREEPVGGARRRDHGLRPPPPCGRAVSGRTPPRRAPAPGCIARHGRRSEWR